MDTLNEGHANQATTDGQGRAHIHMDELNEVTNVCAEDIQLSSPMHFRRVPRRMRQDRYDLVTSNKQLTLDVNKLCCACGCMSMIGKYKLRALRCYYFSLIGDERDTYL